MKKLSIMLVLSWLFALTLGLCAASVQAQEYRYRYVSIGEVELPQGFDPYFYIGAPLLNWSSEDHKAINNSGKIYGQVFDESFNPHIAVYANGRVTFVPEVSLFWAANEGGTIGGGVLVDPENFIIQAALIHGSASGRYRVELIPPLPGESFSAVIRLNDSGMALVSSFDADSNETLYLYKNGEVKPVDFGPTIAFPSNLNINNQGIISGTSFFVGLGARGFRFDPRTGEVTLLHPLATEPESWALDINAQGKVLGYSFIGGGLERIGVWDRYGEFETYFVEGSPPDFPPTISNNLLFNDNNLIVITNVSRPPAEVRNSYLVPKPGVRLNLADLVENLPSGQGFQWIISLNDNGDMIGLDCPGGFCSQFLLQRIGAGDGN